MVRLDRFTLSLIYLREDGPVLSEQELAELQDRHLAHNADLRGAGGLLINGGRHRIEVYPWLVPAGSIAYRDVPVPRSAAEVEGP